MSGSKKRHLNKSHPDCAEYTKKYNELWDSYVKFKEEEEAKYPNWTGLDHPANSVIVPAFRKMCADIKELQKKYSHLFTEEVSDD